MRRLPGVIIALTLALAACGGTSPSAPDSTTGAPGTGSGGTVKGSAAITGTIVGTMPTTVAVAGTALTAPVDGAGHFALANVPPGSVQLQLSGGGASATLPLGTVESSQTVDLVVSVTGSSASIDSQVRTGGAAESELEGRVEALPPATASLTFTAAGRLVKTDGSTQFVDGSTARSFSSLAIGMRVHVKGSSSGDALLARLVELQNSQADVPVEVNGIVSELGGSASDFQFKIGSTVVKGDGSTGFFGDGDKPDTFADLKNDLRVEVKGQQRNGFVYATRIHINAPDTTSPPEDTSASIQGTLTSIGGSVPALVLTVGSTTVRTSSSTTVKRRGDFQTLDTLKVGQTLHVVGTRKSDGSIDARLIEIDDDATGGAVEIEGSVGGLKGTCPSVTFGINGYSIATNASTSFDGSACAALKNGDKVKVNGTRQSDGSVLATSVKKS